MEEAFIVQKKYDKRRRIYRKILIITSVLALILIGAMTINDYKNRLPDELNLRAGSEEEFDFNLPASAEIIVAQTVSSIGESNVPQGSLHLNFAEPFTIKSGASGSYLADVKLFGLFSLKEIAIGVRETVEVIPCGTQVGIYLETDGLLVLGTAGIADGQGIVTEPCLNKLYSGDYILAVNGVETPRKEVLIEEIEKSGGKTINLLVRREEKELTVSVTPVKSADGSIKIGAWIRDDTQGIGTLTYVSQDGSFGALGHGITDVDTGLLMDIGGGDIYEAEIIGITKGKKGSPGELSGIVRMSESGRMGKITANTGQGIFGEVTDTVEANFTGSGSGMFAGLNDAGYGAIPIAFKQEIELGSAVILSAIEGTVREYEVEIEGVNLASKSASKGLVVQITDERLLALTGGIVQGMSGSPILQDGKLIGAVTHVCVNL